MFDRSYLIFLIILFSYLQIIVWALCLDGFLEDLPDISDFEYSVTSFENIQNKYEVINEFKVGKNNSDVDLDIEALLRKYNKTVECHKVKTEDGYILKMFRIPSETNGTAVFLMHGLLSSADDYVTPGPEFGLAYELSDKNYDVWLGNARGNKHSRQHEYLKPSEEKFWDFSWHEIGIYDLPAMIDYVIAETGQQSIKYIGHSQGTTALFVLGSERPEYNKKISLMIALAPVAFMKHIKSLAFRLVCASLLRSDNVQNALGIYEFTLREPFIKTIKKILCDSIGILTEIFCGNVSFLICGFDPQQQNITNLPVIFGHLPAGSSIKQIKHYGQVIESGRFAKYNYSPIKNMELYGAKQSPEYNLSKITIPVYLFHSDGDWLAQPLDVDKLQKGLGNLVEAYKIPYEKFNHLDYLFAKNANTLVYKKVLNILQ